MANPRARTSAASSGETAAQTIPIRRIDTSEKTARVVIYLAPDETSTLSGMDVDATGGMLSQ